MKFSKSKILNRSLPCNYFFTHFTSKSRFDQTYFCQTLSFNSKSKVLKNSFGMAKNYEDFRTYGKQMVDYICDYVMNIEQRSCYPSQIEPGFLAPTLPKEIPEFPESFKEVLDDFDKKIMPGMVHWNHPMFFAYFGNGNSYPSLLADMLSTATAAIGFSWFSCPSLTELEAIVLDWYAKALDLPDFLLSKTSNPNSKGGGSLQGSASDAIYACILAARERAIKQLKGNNDIHDSVYLPQLVCYASSQSHSSSEKAAKMCYVKFRAIEPDANDNMRGDALERAVKQDIENGLTPFFVVGSLGTTAQVAFDNLVEIGEVCKKYPTMWFHVDGAFGGNSFVVPEMRKYKAGIENIDSIEINPNKLMMTAFDCTCLWVKDIKTFTDAFVVDPLYLQHQFDSNVVDLRHFGIPLSRRFRALKLYFMTRMYGIKGMQDYIRRVMGCGKHFEKLVRADDRFEVRNEVILGLVCFRLVQPDSVNQEFLARMNKSGKIHLTPAVCRGKYIIRFIAGQEHCNNAQVENAWRIIQQFADDIMREVQQNGASRFSRRMDDQHMMRFAYTRVVSKQDHENHSKIQQLGDEATPLLFTDTGNN